MQAYLLRRVKLGRGSCNGIMQFSKKGIQRFRNDGKKYGKPPTDPNLMVFRWGCTSVIPQKNVVNKTEAIHLVSDKTAFREKLNTAKLCPKTWFSFNEWVTDGEQLPIIVRPRVHAQGKQLYVCRSLAEVRRAFECCPGGYGNLLINKTEEFRVFVCQGRAVWVAQKTPANPDEVAWNVARGGRFDNVTWDKWPLKAIKTSIQAMELSGLDFGGVDIMLDKEGGCYVLEINAAPSQTSPYRQECVAKAFDYILDHGKDKIPLVEAKGDYKKFIHPAICERALM